MKIYTLTFLLGTLIAGALSGCDPAAPKQAITREVLLQTSKSWDETPYIAYPNTPPELSILKLKIPAHTALDWHSHPIPNAAYILAGELTVESKGSGQVRHFKQGDAVAEMVNTSHRGTTGDKPVELIVFYAGSHGIPLSE